MQYEKSLNSDQFDLVLEEASQKIDSGFDSAADSIVNAAFIHLKATQFDSVKWYVFSYNIQLNEGKYQDVIHLADSVISRIKNKCDDNVYRRMYADALFAKGDALYKLGVFPAGLRAYYLAQQIGRRYDDECVMADFAYRLARINFKQERYREAAVNYQRALQRFDVCQSPSFVTAAYHQMLLNNIAISLTRAGLVDSALLIFEYALRELEGYSRIYNNRSRYWNVATAVVNGNKAEALILKKNYVLAEEILQQSMKNSEYAQREPLDYMLSQLKLAEVYDKTNRTQEAESLMEEMQQSPLLVTHARAAFKWHVLWSNIQFSEGNYKDATLAMQSAMMYRDRFLEERKRYLMLNLDENIRLMNQADRNEVLIAKVERNNLIIIVTLLALLLILLAGTLLYVNFRKSSKYVSLLTLLNERIKNQKGQLERTLVELRQSHQEKDRIMQMVAHDLRSPVASIYWLANVMLEDENLNEEQHQNMELILLASNNSLSLTKDMLEAVSLLQTNELSRTTSSITKLLDQQIQLHSSSLENKSLQLHVTQPEGLVEASVDVDKFGQVISNLLTNAIKFSMDGGRIEVSLSENETEFQLKIRDHGIGLQPGNEEKIFEAFSEARRNGTKGEKSYGLGLSIARRIIDLHGGSIIASNHPEGGAVFSVVLPKNSLIDIR